MKSAFTVSRRLAIGSACSVLFSLWILLPVVYAVKNDVPSGAQQTVVNRPPQKPIWWFGSINPNGDVDWYWFELEEPALLHLAFEKPSNKEFFCSLYSQDNTEDEIVAVEAGNAGEPFIGYTIVDLQPGSYYLKIWGAPGHFCNKEDEVYKYAVELPPESGASSSESDDSKDKQKKMPQPRPTEPPEQKEQEEEQQQQKQQRKEPMELSEEEAARLLDAHDEEERERREMKRMQAPQMDTRVEKDW